MRARFAAIIRLAITDAREDFTAETVHTNHRHRSLKSFEDGTLYLRAYSHTYSKLTIKETKDMLSKS